MRKLHFSSIGLIFILLFSLSGCTKFGKNVTIEGRVLNPVTNKPISGITVFLHINHNYKTIKKIVTGNDGKFELSAGRVGLVWAGFDYAYKEYYALGFYYQEKYYSELKPDKGKVIHVNCYLVPYGKMELNINNINCLNTDTMYFKKQWLLDKDKYNKWSTPRIGCYLYDGDPFKLPTGKYIYTTRVISGGETNYFYDTIFVNKDNVAILNIDY